MSYCCLRMLLTLTKVSRVEYDINQHQNLLGSKCVFKNVWYALLYSINTDRRKDWLAQYSVREWLFDCTKKFFICFSYVISPTSNQCLYSNILTLDRESWHKFAHRTHHPINIFYWKNLPFNPRHRNALQSASSQCLSDRNGSAIPHFVFAARKFSYIVWVSLVHRNNPCTHIE